MLSDRKQQILRALIEEYVSHAMPVGSRTITEHYRLGVSSATVRNELSALEEAGYITQPHTSAGRIPTDAGYRQFVDSLLEMDATGALAESQELVSQLRNSADAIDRLVEETSAELARLTECLSIISAPTFTDANIRQISLISLSSREALAVIVMQDTQVLNKPISFSEDVSIERLSSIEGIVQSLFQGRTKNDLSTVSGAQIQESLNDPLTAYIVDELVYAIQKSSSAKASRLGLSSLLRKPEFHDSSSLLPLMEILEDDTVVFKAYEDASASSNELSIKIGKENTDTKLQGVSVVAGVYGRGSAQGVVAVIGPKRMDYKGVIAAVRAAQNALSDTSCA